MTEAIYFLETGKALIQHEYSFGVSRSAVDGMIVYFGFNYIYSQKSNPVNKGLQYPGGHVTSSDPALFIVESRYI